MSEQPAPSSVPTLTRYSLRAREDPTFILFHLPDCGWASTRLGYHEGIGPYFSLPEALRRAEKEIGEAVWQPVGAEVDALLRAHLIAAERARQARVEGWTPAHDDSHQSQELLDAAECYIEQVIHPQSPPSRFVDSQVRPVWPWEASWWKPSDDPVRNLVKAGALIAAEIDRLLRAADAARSALPVTEAVSVEEPEVDPSWLPRVL